MQKLKKFLSLALALVIVFGAIAPAMAATTYDVVVHKLEVNEAKIVEIPDYDGSKITDLTKFGTDAKELDGVKFTYWNVSKEQYEAMSAAPESYATVELVKQNYTGIGDGTEFVTAGGNGYTVTGLKEGYYWFVEHKGSDLGNGKTLSGAAAVPFGLQLPVYKQDGSTFTNGENALHVYPKNTVTNEPEVDKDIVGHEDDETNTPVDFTVGDSVPYTVKTTIKPGAKYQTAYWDDKMTEGLTFNKDVKVTIGGVSAVENDYKITEDDKGFKLELTEAGLEKINDKPENVEIVITYSATLNSAAVVEIPESNDVTFHYGNNPGKGNTPIPTKPENGKITATKSWADGTIPEGVEVTFTLYNAQTGVKVERADNHNPYKVISDGTSTISYTWTGLDAETEYKVEETWNGYDAEYKLTSQGQIEVVNHKTNNPKPINPDEPKVVTYGKKFVKTDGNDTRLAGAQFVVTNSKGQYLARKSESASTEAAQALAAAKTALDNAIKAYNERTADADEASLLANIATAQKTYDEAFVAAKTVYEWIDAANVDAAVTAGALVLTSNDKGQFEITGLAAGDYSLVEVKAPKDYAKLTSPVNFEVKKGSYTTGDIDYVADEVDGNEDAQQVINKKVTIPQTGGIGTIIFTVGGIALMGGAAIAMKKNKEEDEE